MIPAGIARVVYAGHLGGGEIFETGYWLLGDYGTQALTQTAADTEATQLGVSALLTTLQSMITADSGYDEVRVYGYPTGGPTATFVASAAIGAPGTGAGSLPDQVALVATLLTGAAGRRRRGRMYFPANGLVLAAHQVQNTTVDNLADRLAAYWTAFVIDATHGPVVLSQIAGTAHPILDVRVDSRADIQRRRANKQTIAHQHSAAV
jgi:hypothetical protein